jgi:integrase/recombinase XerD
LKLLSHLTRCAKIIFNQIRDFIPQFLHEKLAQQLKSMRSSGTILVSERGPIYGECSIQAIVKNSTKKAGILKNIHAHTLRHSFATHLVEAGVDIRYIQELLGHANLQATPVYTHVASKNIQKIAELL